MRLGIWRLYCAQDALSTEEAAESDFLPVPAGVGMSRHLSRSNGNDRSPSQIFHASVTQIYRIDLRRRRSDACLALSVHKATSSQTSMTSSQDSLSLSASTTSELSNRLIPLFIFEDRSFGETLVRLISVGAFTDYSHQV
jgi:hypothetical protein